MKVILRACLKSLRAKPRRGENWRETGVYSVVNEDFESIFNKVLASAVDFKQALNGDRRNVGQNTCVHRLA